MTAELREARAEGGSIESLREALRRRDRQLEALEAVGARIQRAESVDEVLEAALQEILARMKLTAAWVFLGEATHERRLRLARSIGLSPAYLDRARSSGRVDPCLCLEVFDSGRPMQARNTTQCPRMPDLIDGLDEPVAHASVPLRFEGPSRGVLNVAASPGQVFSDDELRFLGTLGRQIGLAIERARHREAERRLDVQARAMMAIDKSIGGGTLDPAAVIDAVSATARQVLDTEYVYVLLGSDPRSVTVAHASGEAGLETGQTVDLVAMGWQLAVRAMEEREAVRFDDRSDDRVNRREAERIDVASALINPLVAHDHVEGVLLMCRCAPGPWSPDQLEIAEALAAQAAVALENARLYQEARRAYRELRDAQSRIIQSEKMAVLGTFASGLAHEVRNPLNSIALQLSLLERRTARIAPEVGARTAELVSIIREEVRRLDGLVGDFLLFARSGQVRHQPSDLRALAAEVVRLLAPEGAAAGVELTHEPGEGPPPQPEIDAERMKQVLINLVRNGIEALSAGGSVRVAESARDGTAWLHVSDDGPGLPPELDVFQLFVTSKPGGTGLGLPIAQQIVHEHGGEITAESSPGRGTTFSVRLPPVRPGPPHREMT